MPCRATDSTGLKLDGEGAWNAREHGGPEGRAWRRIRPGIDVQTLEIRAVGITGGESNTGDAPMLPQPLDQIPRDRHIGSVTADGACDTRRCHNAIADRGASKVILPRGNARSWRPDSALVAQLAVRAWPSLSALMSCHADDRGGAGGVGAVDECGADADLGGPALCRSGGPAVRRSGGRGLSP